MYSAIVQKKIRRVVESESFKLSDVHAPDRFRHKIRFSGNRNNTSFAVWEWTYFSHLKNIRDIVSSYMEIYKPELEGYFNSDVFLGKLAGFIYLQSSKEISPYEINYEDYENEDEYSDYNFLTNKIRKVEYNHPTKNIPVTKTIVKIEEENEEKEKKEEEKKEEKQENQIPEKYRRKKKRQNKKENKKKQEKSKPEIKQENTHENYKHKNKKPAIKHGQKR